MKRATLLSIIGFLALYCFAQPKPHDRESLLVAPFATDIKYAAFNRQDQVTYTVQESYPATDVLAFISEKLIQRGWKPLQQDFLNPKIPSSHVTGWGAFDDATVVPEQRVYQWMAQWQDDKHNVVSYTLQYRYAKKDAKLEPDEHMSALHVLAIYVPAPRAALMRKQ